MRSWAEAEARLGDPDAFEQALIKLPERVAWLMRAMQALEEGERATVKGVAAAATDAGHPDIAKVLELLCVPPSELNPTELRRRAKRAGLGKQLSFPYLDLLRRLAVFHVGASTTSSAELNQARRIRPALDAAVRLLTGQSHKVYRYDGLCRWSPRAEQLEAVGHAMRLGILIDTAWLTRNFDRAHVEVDAERWLERDPPQQRALRRSLTGDQPWHPRHVDWLLRQPEPCRRAWLERLLGRMHELLSTGAPSAFEILIAERLATSLQDTATAQHLSALRLRLQWWEDPDTPPLEVLEMLWEHLSELPVEAKLTLARVAQHHEMDCDDDLLFEADLVLVAHTDDDAEMEEILFVNIADTPTEVVRMGLVAVGCSPQRLRLVLGLLATSRGQLGPALRALNGARDAPPLVLIEAIAEILPEVSIRRAEQRALRHALEHIAKAPAELVLAAQDFLPWTEPPPAYLSALQAAQATDPGAAIATYMRMGQHTEAAEAVRTLGRTLRRLDDQGLSTALYALAQIFYQLSPELDAPVHDVILPLTRYVSRDPNRLLHAVTQLHPEVQARALGWYLRHHATLGNEEAWLDILLESISALTPGIPPFIEAMLREPIRSVLAQGTPLTPPLLMQAATKALASHTPFDTPF